MSRSRKSSSRKLAVSSEQQRPVDRVASRLMRDTKQITGELLIPDGASALKDAIDWALRGIEDQNSMICLCPMLKEKIREFLREKKSRTYMSSESLSELEENLLLAINNSKPKPVSRRIKGKIVTYWSC